MTKSLLKAHHISKTYKEGSLETNVLDDVSFELMTGEMLAVVGSSGSGKSTLMHILGLLDHPTYGELMCGEDDLLKMSRRASAKYRNEHMGFVYQFHHLLTEFNAVENVAMPLLIAGQPVYKARKAAEQCLKRVGLQHRFKHRPAELSGGERQRVAIARAIVNQPRLVLADEPTGNLDHETGLSVYHLLRELNQQLDTSFVVVTHDLTLADKLDRQLVLRNGKLVD
ncbi:lipoprotein-releasing ABC transporter ATP-binding protein LolD [Echinimonas agarilytica]|uniref:Lipoprotein-releasing system ATP-binding protein LolD n=1 Tax=Echinimonas agarilytica TaxID=1215918 RepID=A0AA41W6Z1_9GAMM|nr:lipoprotein-releasing ABC transporter ATP-binding protein LolD [Echinimonas agarilytica]MCM2679939.1 lipoprotein-releasing ABC transporter ATP-binding protein LolD [Echinimonas agarilytica]